MEIEIVEFYPLEGNESTGFISGTLKIRLSEQGIIIMGVFVSRSKGRYFFSMPGRMGVHHKTGEKIRYPAIVFEDHEKQKELMEAIRNKAPAFIEMRLANVERPLNLASGAETHDCQGKNVDVQQSDSKSHPVQSVAVSENFQPLKSIKTKQWIDPPVRKDCVRGGLKNKLVRKSS